MHSLPRSLAIALPLFLWACPGEDKPTCGNLDTTLMKRDAPVSFSREVAPILGTAGQTCSFRSSCHGTELTSNGLYLADPIAARLHGRLVGVPSRHLPSMPIIKAGDPQSSYLMRKLDNTHCQLSSRCDKGDCGLAMPFNSDPLEPDVRNIVRTWILEGAPNN